MFDPRPLCCSSLTTAVGGTKDTNFVDSESPYRGTNHTPCSRLCVARRVAHRIIAQGTLSRAPWAVSWHLPQPCRACIATHPTAWPRAPVTIRPFVSRHNPPAARPFRAPRLLCAQAGRIVACLGCIVVVSPAVSWHSPAISWPVSAVSWPCPWPYRGPCCMSIRALCHDTVHCIVTKCKMGSSPACCLHLFFYFFFLILATRKPPFFFHFPILPNKFIKVYFIYFLFFNFFQFFSSILFFSLCSIHQAHKPYNSYTTTHVKHTIHT